MNPNKPEISGDEWLLFLLLMAMCPRPPMKTQEELEHDEIIADYYRQQELGEHRGHGDIDE